MTNANGNRTVIVAGGTGALGAAVTRAFLATGANVAVTYRRREEFDALRAEPTAAKLSGAEIDVTNEDAARKFVQQVASENGSIDALVITVGGYAGGKNVWEADAATFDTMIDLNLRAAWAMARAVAPIMIRQDRGAIVNVASRAAYGSSPGAALYAASKAGVLALWASLAEELKQHNINVNSVVPSIMDTPANRRAMPKANFDAWPKTEDVAKVILFLCSDDAKLVQGAAIPVYGKT
jgi:NAD(P)-dependent dehydrogenase (short-subunit alcohol dehydrogenase family)